MEVPDQVLLVTLDRGTSTAGVVAPCGEEAGRDLGVRIADNLTNKSKLSFRDLILQRWNVAKSHPNRVVRNVIINYLCNCDAQYSSNTAVKEDF